MRFDICSCMVLALGFSVLAPADADVVVLKSGKRIEGEITEETKDYIAVMYNGSPVYYDRKYIGSIEKNGRTASALSAPPAVVPQRTDDTPSAGRSVVEDDRGFLERGLDAGINRRFEEAGRALADGLKLYPDDDQLTGALDIVDKVRSGAVSADYAVKIFQGFKFALMQRYDDARRVLSDAYAEHPDDTDLNFNLGIVEYELGDFENAVKHLRKVADAEPDSGEIYGRIGNAYYMLGDYQRAQENLLIAMGLFRKAGDSATADEVKAALAEIEMPE